MQAPFANLLALLCIALQALLGAGVGQPSLRTVCPIPESCECTASCCNQEPEPPSCCTRPADLQPAKSACCCAAPARAPSQPAPRNDQSSPKQLRFTPAPITTLTWLPATLSPARRVVLSLDTPATRTSSGLTTTRILV